MEVRGEGGNAVYGARGVRREAAPSGIEREGPTDECSRADRGAYSGQGETVSQPYSSGATSRTVSANSHR